MEFLTGPNLKYTILNKSSKVKTKNEVLVETLIFDYEKSSAEGSYDPDMGTNARFSCSSTGWAWLSTLSDKEAIAKVKKQGIGKDLRDIQF